MDSTQESPLVTVTFRGPFQDKMRHNSQTATKRLHYIWAARSALNKVFGVKGLLGERENCAEFELALRKYCSLL